MAPDLENLQTLAEWEKEHQVPLKWDHVEYVEDLLEAPIGQPFYYPCPGCDEGWAKAFILMGDSPPTDWQRARRLILGICRKCMERKEDRDRAHFGPPRSNPRDNLYVDEQGRLFYQIDTDRRPPWERIGIDEEFGGYSLAKKKCKLLRKGVGIRRADREPGITYVNTKDSAGNVLQDKAAVESLRELIDGKQFLFCCLLAGNNGTGKTHFAMAAAQDMAARGKAVVLFNEPLWQTGRLKAIGEPKHADAVRSADMYQKAHDAQVLIWDELAFVPGRPEDAGKIPQPIVRDIASLIYSRREGKKKTIWTTNATLSGGLASRLGPALVSRIKGDCQGQMFWFGGRDWRDDA